MVKRYTDADREPMTNEERQREIRITRRVAWGLVLGFVTIWVGFVLVVLVGCHPAAPGPFSPPVAPPGPLPKADICLMFCDTLGKMGCPGAEGSPGPDERYGTNDDRPCDEVCGAIVATGVYTGNAQCLVQAQTCDIAERCLLGD